MLGTLTHVIDVASLAACRASGSDDHRTVESACAEIRFLTRQAICTLDGTSRAVSRAHEVIAHLIFAAEDGAGADA